VVSRSMSVLIARTVPCAGSGKGNPLTRGVLMTIPLYVGIDVGKAKNVACFMGPDGSVLLKRRPLIIP